MFFQRLITAFILLELLGCSTASRHAQAPATVAPPAKKQISERESLARQLLEKRDLAQALVQWNILRTIEPENAEYRDQVRALQKIISEEAEHHFATGLTNLRLGAYDTARLSFLKVLALNPKRRDALSYLREIDEQQARIKPNNGMPDPAYNKRNIRSGPGLRK